MGSDVEVLKMLLETYFENKYKILGDMQYRNFGWAYFFAPTLQGKRTYCRESILLEEQIKHLSKQAVDLKLKDLMLTVSWCSAKLQKERAYITLWVQTDKTYKGVGGRRTVESVYHRVECIRIAGRWYIESDWYGGGGIEVEGQYSEKKEYIVQTAWQRSVRGEAPKGIYKRDKAVAYAKKHAHQPTHTKWKNYSKWGGNCTNFVSQCLYAGEIPFDHVGPSIVEQWYWYSDAYRTPSFTGANAFKEYCLRNTGMGLVAMQSDLQQMEPGDVVQLGTLEETTHTMLVVDCVYKDKSKKKKVDLLIAQHSSEGGIFGYGIPLSIKSKERIYYKILGYNPQYT